MSQAVLRQSKFICFFQIDPSLHKENVKEVMRPQGYACFVYHFHYSAVYYPALYRHFKIYLPATATEKNIRFNLQGKQLPSDLPIGLFLHPGSTLKVVVSEMEIAEGYKFVLTSWKKAYTIINPSVGCDYVQKRLNKQQKRQLYGIYCAGHSNNVNKQNSYEGKAVALRIFWEGVVVQRKVEEINLTPRQYLIKQFGEIMIDSRLKIWTHAVEVDQQLTLKQLLQEWNYNDGYCYLKLTY